MMQELKKGDGHYCGVGALAPVHEVKAEVVIVAPHPEVLDKIMQILRVRRKPDNDEIVMVSEYRTQSPQKIPATQLNEIMQKLETERNAARRGALEYAAQKCRYYIKHQDYPKRWEAKSDYQQGVQVACENLAEIMLEEAGKYPPNAEVRHGGPEATE